jgi:hypothetical protein
MLLFNQLTFISCSYRPAVERGEDVHKPSLARNGLSLIKTPAVPLLCGGSHQQHSLQLQAESVGELGAD